MYRLGEFAQKIGLSVSTVRRLELGSGTQVPRGAIGQRCFTDTGERKVLLPSFAAMSFVPCMLLSTKPR
ncbi:hypothetical protein ACH347_17095 [Saccharopolyspora sp. 5N102]|uniref:hypothetical protein n=1 Tax=Saccharopolyspora sp. 5N102 TaxID=3375155 RepID=UPI0037A45D5E